MLILFLIFKQTNIRGAYLNKWHNINFVIGMIFALIILSIAQMENYYDLKGLFITKVISLFIMFFILSINIYRQHRIIKINNENNSIIPENVNQKLLSNVV